MSIHKITPFLSDIKTFFKNSDMTAAMQNISFILSRVKMTERDTLAVLSKPNCTYRLLTIFQCLLLFPCFGIRNAYHNQKYGTLAPLVKARKDVFYRFMEIQVLIGAERCGTYLSSYGIRSVFVPNINRKTYVLFLTIRITKRQALQSRR